VLLTAVSGGAASLALGAARRGWAPTWRRAVAAAALPVRRPADDAAGARGLALRDGWPSGLAEAREAGAGADEPARG
jgi:hypothetical protein